MDIEALQAGILRLEASYDVIMDAYNTADERTQTSLETYHAYVQDYRALMGNALTQLQQRVAAIEQTQHDTNQQLDQIAARDRAQNALRQAETVLTDVQGVSCPRCGYPGSADV